MTICRNYSNTSGVWPMLKSAPYFWVVTYLKLTLSGLKLGNWWVECKNTGSYNRHSPCLCDWHWIGEGKKKESGERIEETRNPTDFSRFVLFLPSPFLFLYQACKLLPSLPFSSALLPTPPPLLPLFAKDGHKMLWTGCKKVIALSPTLTYMYMYTGVRYSWTATTAISAQQPPLQWPLFLADSLYSQSCFNLSTVATFFCSQSGCCREVQL